MHANLVTYLLIYLLTFGNPVNEQPAGNVVMFRRRDGKRCCLDCASSML